MSFDEYVMALVLCGHMKYEAVEGMSLAQRVAGIVANLLGEKDEQQVLTEVLAPRVERLSTAGVVALPGMDAAVHALFMRVWAKMDLGHLYGFPLWEKAVFTLLHRSFPELHSTFVTYSKRDDSGSATALETMQQTELVDLALDCGLATAAFPMARVQLVFARADMTEAGKAGDQALELHEFLEAVVQLSFSRANPRCGEAGHEHVAPAHPLPGCLEQLLHKSLLKRAKLDGLAKLKAQIQADAAAQDAFRVRVRVRVKVKFRVRVRVRVRSLTLTLILTLTLTLTLALALALALVLTRTRCRGTVYRSRRSSRRWPSPTPRPSGPY